MQEMRDALQAFRTAIEGVWLDEYRKSSSRLLPQRRVRVLLWPREPRSVNESAQQIEQ
jgi:hypothetical protein